MANKKSKIFKELKEEEIKKIIELNFGEKIKYEYKLLEGGLFNSTYFIEIENLKKIILRVGPVNRELILPYEQKLMRTEEYVYKLCEKNNLECSKILIIDNEKKVVDRDYMIVEFIESKALSLLELNEKEEGEIYYSVGEYIRKFHNIKGNSFGRVVDVIEEKGFEYWSEALLNEFNSIENQILEFEVFTKEEMNSFKDIIKKYKKILDEINEKTLVHGDLWSGNVLVGKREEKYEFKTIIDGDRSWFGDFQLDFANPWIINENFLEGYGYLDCNDEKTLIRKKIYKLFYSVIDCYVWKVQYNNEEVAKENKNSALNLVEELKNYDEK